MNAQAHRLSTSNYNEMLSNRYKTVINHAAQSTLKALDLTRYTGRVTTNPVLKGFSRMNLSTFLKVKKINKTKINKKNLLFIVSFLLITQGNTYANAATSSDHYKLYLHSKVINYKQFICAVEVGHRESRWNWHSTNGNHWGIFQMENPKVKHMNAYTQIDWWLRYVNKRYKGQPCLSLAHLKQKGWQ